jgi:hypothetical protein
MVRSRIPLKSTVWLVAVEERAAAAAAAAAEARSIVLLK